VETTAQVLITKTRANASARNADKVLRTLPILASAGIPAPPPDVRADDLWIAFKKLAFDYLVDSIKMIEARFPDDPRERKERLRGLCREHHLLYVADRLRRSLGQDCEQTAAELTQAARYILDRKLYPASIDNPFGGRTLEDRRALTAARVHWHKLMSDAGAKPPGREGGWSQPDRAFRGSAKLFQALDKPGVSPNHRSELLRKYVEGRLEHLVAVSKKVAGPDPRALTQDSRILLNDLETVLSQARRLEPSLEAEQR
jgi:hypothetical protein